MNVRGILKALCLVGLLVTPAVAQLIHVSVDMPDGFLLFKANRADISWNQSGGFVTQLDFAYDSQEQIGALDPGRNYWRMRVENPEMGRVFTITRPFQSVIAWDHGLVFDYFVSTSKAYESVELKLVFNSPISAEGELPKLPLPALGSTEYNHSQFTFWSGNSMFGVPNLAEVYGGGAIQSISTSMTPIPEPSVFGLAALVIVGAAIGMRRGSRNLSSQLKL